MRNMELQEVKKRDWHKPRMLTTHLQSDTIPADVLTLNRSLLVGNQRN